MSSFNHNALDALLESAQGGEAPSSSPGGSVGTGNSGMTFAVVDAGGSGRQKARRQALGLNC